MSRESFYFKHDYNARNDPKMVKLRRESGAAAYGVAWMIVEMLHENGGRISHDPEIIAYEIREPRELIEKVISSEVFFVKDGMIGSERVDRERDDRRAAQEAGREALGRRKRPDGSPWVKGATRDLVGPYRIPTTRRGEEKEKEITTANGTPSAVDLSGKLSKDLERQRLEGRLEDAGLPFNYGEFVKGVRIRDLPIDTIKDIIKRMPRLGGETEALLRLRVTHSEEEKTPAQRRRSA